MVQREPLLFSVPSAATLLANILWLQEVWQYSAIRTGFAIAPGPAMVPLFRLIAHRLARRIPIGYIVAAGSLMYSIGGLYTSFTVTAGPKYATSCCRACCSAVRASASRYQPSCRRQPPTCH